MKIGPITPPSDNSYTYSEYTIPSEIMNRIPNSTEGIIRVGLSTYDNGEQIGSTAYSYFTAKVPDSVIPSIDSCVIEINNNMNSIVKSWDVALAGYSGAKITAKTSGAEGSTVKSCKISGAYNAIAVATDSDPNCYEYEGPAMQSSGNYKFIVTCTDSRGRVSNEYISDEFRVLPYSPPDVKKLTITKNEHGTDDISDDRMIATAEWSIDVVSDDNGNARNSTASANIYYKQTNEDSWHQYPFGLENGIALELSSMELIQEASYNFKIIVTDLVGEQAERSTFSSTTVVLMDFKAGGDGLGIGKICESPGMEVSMNATFYNDVNLLRESTTYELKEYIEMLAESIVFDKLNGIDTTILEAAYPIGSIYISTSNTDPKTLFGIGTWERIQDRFLLAAGGTYTAGETGGEAVHTLTIEEMPSHAHTGVRRSDDTISGTGSTGTSSGSGSTVYRTDPTGQGQAHNNMPPYLVVYVWERTE